jgi:hypothetical protein
MSFDNNNRRSAENDSLEMESYAVLEAGIYHAKLESIDNLETKFGEALRFNWRVIGGDSDGETFTGLANKKLMPKSKLATWAKAHLALNAFPEGFVLQLSSLIGKEVHATLATEARTDGSGDRNTIAAISPYKAATKKAKPTAKPEGNGFTGAFDDIPESDEPLRKSEGRVEA